ncbi:hypothetical protein Gasu2_42550 [Galdieria sulphuraria]|uniref:ATP synthase protein I-like protein n=1 Tax=Galdieria sulphuraria TaxID=130081 RepID=M2XQQ8_GALSU|nr:ATP synthase protein I-like protein [Galdieria sulphuraria]EME25963.1 ATP synthase protein I-like protein [Galdieria sulphuraria]GJD10035.1 hypothetical protein Gasu2_42550 [Galdieria sulphuraria]|eukprot:XP_005702483.1 ATP synthase protein I-like protein [Galdieria sulphuraria]
MWMAFSSPSSLLLCIHKRQELYRSSSFLRKKRQGIRTVTLSSISKKDKGKNDWGFRPPDIPTLEERYRAELAYVEEKFGPKRYETPELRDPLKTRILTNQEKAKQERSRGIKQYQDIKRILFGATLGVGAFLIPLLGWLGSGKIACSYAFGLGGSLIYVWLLSRSVERLASSSTQSFRDWLGPARLAIVALLILTVSKHREELELLPVFLGFLTYKVATFFPLLLENWNQDNSSEVDSSKNSVKKQATDSSSLVI